MRKFIILFSACFLLFACTKEPAGIDKSPEPLSKSGDAMASMQELAAALPAMFSDNTATKSTYSAAVTDITPLADILWSISQRSATGGSGVMTLSNSISSTPDTAAVRDIYVVNYEDGFAILSNIPQSPSVLAYAPQGSLTTNTDPDPGLAILLENIPVYASAMVDSLFETHTVYRENSRPDLTTITGKQGQFLTTHWHQGTPFNNKMGYGGCTDWLLPNGRYPVGCVALAVGQIMTYHGYPAVVGGIAHNWAQYRTYSTWSDIPSSVADNIAALLYDIGQKTNTVYGCSGSSSDIYKAQTAFVNYGYSCGYPVGYNNSNLSTVKSNIDASRPLLMTGTRKNSNIGHAWVVDGHAIQNTYKELWEDTYNEAMVLIRSVYKGIVSAGTYTMLHFNLGNGDSNIGDLYTNADLFSDKFEYPNAAKIIPNIQKANASNHITITGSVPNYTIRASSPVASTLTIGCMAADTLTELRYTLPAGQSYTNITSYYTLSGVTSVYPSSDATYRYTY